MRSNPSTTLPAHAPPRRRGLATGVTLAATAVAAALVLQTPAAAFGATGVRSLVASTAPRSTVRLATGTYAFSDFSPGVGLALAGRSLIGTGTTSTVVQMDPYSSTKRAAVPTTVGRSNPLSLMQASGSPVLSGFWLKGTPQGHLYNGLQLLGTSGARVSDVKISAVPGDDHVPPGETFGLNDLHTSGSQYSDLEIDGSGVGASGFAANMSSNLSITGGYFHDNPYSAGVTLYRTANATLTDVRSIGNRMGLNFEQDSGTIEVVRPTIRTTVGTGGFDLFVGAFSSAARIDIRDPQLAPGQKLRILLAPTYGGRPNAQRRSDVHVYVGGVEKTSSLVTWYGG